MYKGNNRLIEQEGMDERKLNEMLGIMCKHHLMLLERKHLTMREFKIIASFNDLSEVCKNIGAFYVKVMEQNYNKVFENYKNLLITDINAAILEDDKTYTEYKCLENNTYYGIIPEKVEDIIPLYRKNDALKAHLFKIKSLSIDDLFSLIADETIIKIKGVGSKSIDIILDIIKEHKRLISNTIMISKIKTDSHSYKNQISIWRSELKPRHPSQRHLFEQAIRSK